MLGKVGRAILHHACAHARKRAVAPRAERARAATGVANAVVSYFIIEITIES